MTTRARKKRRPVELTDPRAIRALAHPARLAVIEELYSGSRELTATECAEIAGMSPSAMSYHLRALEKAGIVERAKASGDGRERPWRAVGDSLRVDSAGLSAAAEAATDVLGSTMLERVLSEYGAYHERRRGESAAWREAAGLSSAQLWLRPEEAADLQNALFDAMERYRHRSKADHPEGTRRVRLALLAYPVDRPG